jgi:hypothetical protein
MQLIDINAKKTVSPTFKLSIIVACVISTIGHLAISQPLIAVS